MILIFGMSIRIFKGPIIKSITILQPDQVWEVHFGNSDTPVHI